MKYNLELDFRKDPINALLTLVLYILLSYIIYQLISKLLGHSWQLDVITLTLVIGLLINEARKERRWGEFVGEMREFKRNTIEFQTEMRDFQREMGGFQKRMLEFKARCTHDLSKINNKLFGEKAD